MLPVPSIDRMGSKGLARLTCCLLQAILLPKFFGLPSLARMHEQAHLSQEPMQMLFTHLDRTEGPIPRAVLPWTSHRLDIFYHNRSRVAKPSEVEPRCEPSLPIGCESMAGCGACGSSGSGSVWVCAICETAA